VADLKKGEPELFVLLVYFAGDWEMHRRYGREEKKETIPIYQLAGLHRRWRVRSTRRHWSLAQKSC
jgi:hypothetical protein